MKIAILQNKNRLNTLSIGALVLQDELQRQGYTVEVCNYQTAFNYSHVLVSMTAVDDIYDLYRNMHRNNWQKRTFLAFVGGFGCQNPIALQHFCDYAFFGRADGVIADFLQYPKKYTEHCFAISSPHKVKLRQVDSCYPNQVNYGANKSNWTEKFIGCPYRCKFCHYSHNRKYVGNGTYINNGISTGSPEVMLKDICKLEERQGRLTAALDGYSERLRYAYGKRISWDMVEEAMDTLASFKGNTYFKLYNICNFPTETKADEEEFVEFWKRYTSETQKADGVVVVDVFNTAFRPSLNTPMERCGVMLYPEARREVPEIAQGKGFSIRYTHLSKGWKEHYKDVVAIRYTNIEHIERIALHNELLFTPTDYLREYSQEEDLPFKFFS
ncbi:MAG: hypothetical protein ACRC9X_04890 [Bacteroidales bacterium]